MLLVNYIPIKKKHQMENTEELIGCQMLLDNQLKYFRVLS